jgi:hypothetical protein
MDQGGGYAGGDRPDWTAESATSLPTSRPASSHRSHRTSAIAIRRPARRRRCPRARRGRAAQHHTDVRTGRAGVGTQARAARRTPVARADPMIATSSTAVKAAPPRRSNKTAHLDEVVGAVRRLRAGETLLPLDEVIELLRFAGRRREQEHADARRSPSSLPRTRGPASARRHSTARRSPNASTYPSVRSATTPPTSSPPRRGAHRDRRARRDASVVWRARLAVLGVVAASLVSCGEGGAPQRCDAAAPRRPVLSLPLWTAGRGRWMRGCRFLRGMGRAI